MAKKSQGKQCKVNMHKHARVGGYGGMLPQNIFML